MIDEAALARFLATEAMLDGTLPEDDPVSVHPKKWRLLIAAAREREKLRGELRKFAGYNPEQIVRIIEEGRAKALRAETAERERDEARTALEQTRVQLAGCLIAAEGGDTAEVNQGDYAWTLALETTRKLYAQIAERDVALAGAHDREDALSAALLSQQQATDEAMRRAEEARRG